MKIKRFEARNMSEALRMIKREFGDEAVILSATTAKKNGRLFPLKAGSQVVVTAAIDMTPAKSHPDDTSVSASSGSKEYADPVARPREVPADRVHAILERFEPITRTGLNKLKPKLVRFMSNYPSGAEPPPVRQDQNLYEQLRTGALSPALARDLADQVKQSIGQEVAAGEQVHQILSQILAAKGWVAAEPFLPEPGGVVVLVGAHGAGKTSAAAKIAAAAVLGGIQSPTVISLDHERVAATQELERLARIMGVTLFTAVDQTQLVQVCDQVKQHRLVVVDTPGISTADPAGLQSLNQLLKNFQGARLHLVLNACLREQVMADCIRFFEPLGISRLLFTQLDLVEEAGHLINQIQACDLPAAYMSHSPQVPDGLFKATAGILSTMLLEGVTAAIPSAGQTGVTVVAKRLPGHAPANYVANCNSDIFHEQSCKSVKRIHTDHMLTFADALEAKDQGFKPCRMCCADLNMTKTNDRLVRHRYASRQQVL